MKTNRTLYKLLFTLLLAFSLGSLIMPTSVAHARSASLQSTYTVQPGDTLYRIAQRFGTTVTAIRQANGLSSDAIYVGQQLTISGSQPQPTPVGPTFYTVQRGDTLYAIAQRFGTTVAAIRSANNLSSDSINVGQRLTIPGGGTQPSPERIQFAPGASSATVSGRLQNATPTNYVVRALAGQTMRIELLSDNGVADFSLRGASDGRVLKPLESRDSLWTGTLPSTQDYVIQIASLANENPTYQLSVAITAAPTQPTPGPTPTTQRIQFAPGANSATVSGRLQNAIPINYLLGAQAGQTMRIELLSDNGVADFSLRGASDGRVLKPLESRDSLWTGTLPSTQDYVIQIASLTNESPTYQLSVAITAAPPQPAPQRIQFVPGATWATVRGAASAAQPARYVLHVLSGQTMSINLNADNGSGYITVLKPNGAAMPEAGGELQRWTGTLPTSGNYIIEVFNPGSELANFNLTVAIQ